MARRPRVDLEADLSRQASRAGGAEGLEPFFAACRAQGLFAHFNEADERATRLQVWHRLLAGLAAGAGTFALLLGLLQLGLPNLHSRGLLIAEGILIGLTFLAVFIGWMFDRHKAWLLWRFRAEQYRLLVFRLLADPVFWRTGKPGERSITPEKVAAVSELELDALARKEPSPWTPTPNPSPSLPAALLPFYRGARLEAQIAYFRGTVEREEKKFVITNRRLAPVFLFTGVVFVVAHLIVELTAERYAEAREDWRQASVLLLAISAMWPTAYAGIRTWRSANEYSRNAARAKAKLGVLSEYATALEREKGNPAGVFALLAMAEGLLEAEQREWLRLMLDAEWF